jgi:hypothetical protein
MGWVPLQTQKDDILCRFEGCQLPFVIRLRPDSGGYQLIGEAYVHGAMDELPKASELEIIELV